MYYSNKASSQVELEASSQADLVHSQPRDKKSWHFIRKHKVIIIFSICFILVAIIFLIALQLKRYSAPKKAYRTSPCDIFNRDDFGKITLSNGSVWQKTDCKQPAYFSCSKRFERAPLLLVSLDGFNRKYLDFGLTPNIKKLMDCGVSSKFMRPAFVSKTFPNHYSIVTGLYPEAHGIISNVMYDLNFKEEFTKSNEAVRNGKWWNGEPIWNTVMKANRKSGVIFWPGSEADIQGMRPTYCYKYDEGSAFTARIEQIYRWLEKSKDERPELIAMYLSEPDHTGHTFGPWSKEIKSKLVEVDNTIGTLMDGLIQRELLNCVNIMLISDHGMAEIDCEKFLDIPESINTTTNFFHGDEVGHLSGKFAFNASGNIVETNNGDSPEQLLSKAECSSLSKSTWDEFSHSYLKKDLPVRLHYSNNHRIEDVIVMTRDYKVINNDWGDCDKGQHGFDNIEEDMQAMFLAYGPSFKQDLQINGFDNVELYNLMCEVLHLDPAPTNGTLGRLNELIKSNPDYPITDISTEKYFQWPLPSSKETRDAKRSTSKCKCEDWQTYTNMTMDEADILLNSSITLNMKSIIDDVLPVGFPVIRKKELQLGITIQNDFINAYSVPHNLPYWTAFTLNDSAKEITEIESKCMRTDTRLPDGKGECRNISDGSSMIYAYLFPPEWAKSMESILDTYMSSNAAPMYADFANGVWKTALNTIASFANSSAEINVLSGAVFDNNHDYVSEVTIPSHYYAIILKCLNKTVMIKDCDSESLDVLSFILPHKASMGNCWHEQIDGELDYIKFNVASIKDIEHLTRLNFMPSVKIPTKIKLELKTKLSMDFRDS